MRGFRIPWAQTSITPHNMSDLPSRKRDGSQKGKKRVGDREWTASKFWLYYTRTKPNSFGKIMTSSEGFQTSEVESKREKTDLPLQSWRRLNLGLGRRGTSPAGPAVPSRHRPGAGRQQRAHLARSPCRRRSIPGTRGRKNHPVTSSPVKCTRERGPGRICKHSTDTCSSLQAEAPSQGRRRPRLTPAAPESAGASPRVPGSLAGLDALCVAPPPGCARPTRRRRRGWWGRWSASGWPPSRSPPGCGPQSRALAPGAWRGSSPRQRTAAGAFSCGRRLPGLRGASSWPPRPGPVCARSRGRRGAAEGRGPGPGRRSSRRRPCCAECAGRTGAWGCIGSSRAPRPSSWTQCCGAWTAWRRRPAPWCCRPATAATASTPPSPPAPPVRPLLQPWSLRPGRPRDGAAASSRCAASHRRPLGPARARRGPPPPPPSRLRPAPRRRPLLAPPSRHVSRYFSRLRRRPSPREGGGRGRISCRLVQDGGRRSPLGFVIGRRLAPWFLFLLHASLLSPSVFL